MYAKQHIEIMESESVAYSNTQTNIQDLTNIPTCIYYMQVPPRLCLIALPPSASCLNT